ncbi:MAG: hypothetical protein JRJ85_24490 [Deltaproteobacteria bacterium]|nr:hypothetical protein [Deltaproteobacteria bacterium]
MIPESEPLQQFPEFDVPDWTRLRLDQIPLHSITGFIGACLRDREFQALMMHQYGSLVLGASRNLLYRSQKELMEPLGILTRFMDAAEGEDPDQALPWAEYKKRQRARMMRELWACFRKRRERMRDLAKLFPRCGNNPKATLSCDARIISVFTEPFSSKAQKKMEFDEKLREITRFGLSRLLPWRQILGSEIRGGRRRLGATAPVISDQRKDIIFKFQQLLEFAHEQKIELSQDIMFGEIYMKPVVEGIPSEFTLKDRLGQEYLIDWSDLTENQRKKIATDLQQNRVLLV